MDLRFAEVDRLGTAAFWHGKVAHVCAALEAMQAHLQLAERSYMLALGDLVALYAVVSGALVAGPSRTSLWGCGGVDKGKGKGKK